MATEPVKPTSTPSKEASTPAAEAGTPVLVGSFSFPFRRIAQADRMDDGFACIAMLMHKSLEEVLQHAFSLGYPRTGPAILTDEWIARLLMSLGQLVGSKYKDFHSWEALPDVALVYVEYNEDMDIGRHVLWHHVRASGKQNALSYIIDPAHWIKPEQQVTTDYKRYVPDWYIEVRASKPTKG